MTINQIMSTYRYLIIYGFLNANRISTQAFK